MKLLPTVLILALLCGWTLAAPAAVRATAVSIVGGDFHINDRPTYAGRSWRAQRIEPEVHRSCHVRPNNLGQSDVP